MTLPHISLATKCRILFGAAVLLILLATLFLPWVHMVNLSEAADQRLAEQILLAARLTSGVDDTSRWVEAQNNLSRNWERIAQTAGFPHVVPELISASDAEAAQVVQSGQFLAVALNIFRRDPSQKVVSKFNSGDQGREIRLAMAVRSAPDDPQPSALRGIVHVRLPIHDEHWYWSLIVLGLAGWSGGCLAMLVFYLVTQRLFLSPVRELRQVAEQVTDGDIGVRAEIATGDEFEELADAFNAMLQRIKQSHDELRKINTSLDVKLEELAQTNVTLYESNRVKSEFIANVSHELRTPMGLIINFAELLKDTLEDPPEDKTRLIRYASNILSSGRSLLEIINDLLDLAKMEAGKVTLHITEFSINDTCQSLIDFLQPLADKKGIHLSRPAEVDLPPINSDAGKVKQVLYNLLSNAIKFTPKDGEVQLSASGDGDGFILLSVRDTGPGIADEHLEVIFEKFKQLDSSLTREHSGTGLGLAITKDYVRMLGGGIEVSSEVGEGSVFTVRLPLEPPRESQKPLVRLND